MMADVLEHFVFLPFLIAWWWMKRVTRNSGSYLYWHFNYKVTVLRKDWGSRFYTF